VSLGEVDWPLGLKLYAAMPDGLTASWLRRS